MSVSDAGYSALEVYLYTTMRYINRRFTHLLTYECRNRWVFSLRRNTGNDGADV